MVCEVYECGRWRQCPIRGLVANSVDTSGSVPQYLFVGYEFFCNERGSVKPRLLT
jgi:hypothetical protein